MFRKLGCFTVMIGLTLPFAATASADGINVARFLANNQLAPRANAQPSWFSRRVLQPLREYRHAKRDVKRIRAASRTMDRAFDAAFKKAFDQRFSPSTSTIFGFFAAWARANRAGRLAVIDAANLQPSKWGLSPRSVDYRSRHSAPKK